MPPQGCHAPAALGRAGRLAMMAGAAALALCAIQGAHAGPITASYLAAGAQAPNFPTACASATSCYYGTESFSNWAGGDFNSTFQTGTSNFTGSTFIKGAYTANGDTNWSKAPADQYGGANGTAPYPELFGKTSPGDAYTIKLTRSANIPGVNYFGIWISAMDANSNLQFYNNGQLLYSFGSTDLQAALGACSGTNAYCGNPNTAFKGLNSAELYAYVNFFDTVGYFDQVVLYNPSASTGFESSNHAVAYINPLVVSGTTFNAPDRPPSAALNAKLATLVVNIPEPATVLLVFTALIILLFRYQRRRAARAVADVVAEKAKAPRKRRRRSRSRPSQFGWPASTPSRFGT